MFIHIGFILYFFNLGLFSLVSSPVYCCILLVINSLISSWLCYCSFGFSWYSLLFCLVYIGGVYILFIFVSVYNPNNSVLSLGFTLNRMVGFVGLLLVLMFTSIVYYGIISLELSSFLCIEVEGIFYVCMCMMLIFSFILLSLVMSVKFNYCR